MQFTPVTSEARDVIYCCNSNIVVCLRVASFCFLSFIYHSSYIIYHWPFIIYSLPTSWEHVVMLSSCRSSLLRIRINLFKINRIGIGVSLHFLTHAKCLHTHEVWTHFVQWLYMTAHILINRLLLERVGALSPSNSCRPHPVRINFIKI